MADKDKQITPAALAQCNGAEGKPAYIAYRDRVIDVTNSKLWQGGRHMLRHQAGQDLTEEIKNAPHGLEVLDRFPPAGIFAGAVERHEQMQHLPAFLMAFLNRFPLLKRHPHPALVHFPIAFMFSASLFTAIYLFYGNPSFELFAYYCLGCGLLFSIPAMLSGLFTWWVNYMARPLRLIIIKMILSAVLFIIGLAAFIWRTLDPHVLEHAGQGTNLFYIVLVLLLAPIVLIIGLCGGLLTFPVHKE